jgi:hypothetical protein
VPPGFNAALTPTKRCLLFADAFPELFQTWALGCPGQVSTQPQQGHAPSGCKAGIRKTGFASGRLLLQFAFPVSRGLAAKYRAGYRTLETRAEVRNRHSRFREAWATKPRRTAASQHTTQLATMPGPPKGRVGRNAYQSGRSSTTANLSDLSGCVKLETHVRPGNSPNFCRPSKCFTAP